MKRLLSIAICLLLLFLNIPITVNAASNTTTPTVTLSETEVKPGDTIKFEIKANDPLLVQASGADNTILIRSRVDEAQAISLHPNYNESTEKYELEYTIPSNMLCGEWYIEKVVLQDNVGNKTYNYSDISFTVDSVVSFNSNGGSAVAAISVKYNGKVVAPTVPTNTGYAFGGWYKDNTTFANLFDFTNTQITENLTLFAKWTKNGHAVTFNSQGGSEVISSVADYNGLITAPAAPTKTGYAFSGWYKEAECVNAWDFSTDKVNSDIKLYVKWIPALQRLSGTNRIETSIAIAKEIYKDKAPDAVVLATSSNFPDALAGCGLAYKYNAPLLLVNKTVDNSKNVLDFITTNLGKNKNVYILGGVSAVSGEIADYLTTEGYKIIRLEGIDRYATNQKIVDYMDTPKGTNMVIATGSSFADALSISSIAAMKGYPILLNGKDTLLDSVRKDITNIEPKVVYIIGGTGVISTDIETQIKKLNGEITIVRLGGKDRYETSVKIMESFNLTTNSVTVATGIDFPDALSGSVLAAGNNCSVLLVDNKDITKQQDSLYVHKITNVTVLGGEGVISNDTATTLIQKPIIATPTSVKAVSSSYNSIDISWNGVTGENTYEIYRATSTSGDYTLISTTTQARYKDTGLTNNSIYYYKIKANRMIGTEKMYSDFSTDISAKPILDTPINVIATQINSNSIKLSWNAVSGADGYEIYRAASSTGTYSILVGTGYLYYTNSGLTAGKTYYYKIRAYQNVGTTREYSNLTAAAYKAITNIVYNDLVKSNAVYGTYLGSKVEIIDENESSYLIKNKGIETWVATKSVSVASNPATNRKYLDKKQLETYVNITSNFVSNTNYFTWVDLNRQRVSIFTGSAGHWVLFKTYSCASGNNATPSKRGLFTVLDKGPYFVAESGALVKYWTRYSGNYLLHSILLTPSGEVLDGTLGVRASHGCIRMPLDMAKWYYEKMPKGSLVWVN